jgi:TetR/AcrR family transcriptional regulator
MATKPGERRLQSLQVLAEMLQDPKGEKVTTAALAKRLDVSEAALYRHFASKAQMFEGLIEFIEGTVFGLANKITAEEPDGLKQAHAIVGMLLNFAEKNPGMTRVLIGDALVNEDDRLQARINQLQDRLEATLKQCLRIAATQSAPGPDGEDASGAEDLAGRANLLLCYVVGRWHLFAKGGFKRKPSEQWERQWRMML